MFAASNRLRKRSDILAVFGKGKKKYHPLLRVIAMPNKESYRTRCTVVVSLRVFRRATDRNRLKRQLSSIIKERLDKISGSYDIIVMAQPKAAHATRQELEAATEELFRKHNLYDAR